MRKYLKLYLLSTLLLSLLVLIHVFPYDSNAGISMLVVYFISLIILISI